MVPEQIIELLVIAIVTGPPILNILGTKAVRREFRDRPFSAILVYLVLTAGGIGVIWCCAHPGLLRIMVVLALLIRCSFFYHGRPEYGKSIGLPPGSLALVNSMRALQDRSFYAQESARWGPIFKMSQFRRSVVCIVGFDFWSDLQREHGKNLIDAPLPFNRLIPRGFLRYMSNDDHAHYRRQLSTGFTSEAVKANESYFEMSVSSEFLRMVEDTDIDRTGGINPDPYLERLVFKALAHFFFGIPSESSEFHNLRQLLRGVDYTKSSIPWSARKTRISLENLAALVRDRATLINEERKESQVIGSRSILASIIGHDLTAIADDTLVANLIFMLQISRNNVVGLLRWILKMLSDNPIWMENLRNARAPGSTANGDPDLAERIVLETLRLQQSEYIYRTAKDRIHYRGMVIPRGWLIRFCVHESHRQAEIFSEPDTFNPDRFLDRSFSPEEFSPFGRGAHACIGARVATTLGRIFVECLASCYRWQVVVDGPPERENRHWAHWRPNTGFRLSMENLI